MSDDHNDGSTGTPEWRVPADEQLEADAYHVWKPRPLLRSIQWKPVPEPEKDAATGSYDVFLDQRVFRAMHQHLWNASSAEEPFGFLIGDLCEDPDSGRRYVIVSAAIPSKFQLQEDAPESMPRESLVALELEADRRKGVLAGWYRRRRHGPVELTASDMKMHEMHFPEPWQVAFLFVTDPRGPSGGCFRRALRGLQGDVPLPFHEMVSNESLLARGVRKSRLDWSNVETSDSVEPDPPPRPEPEPEPEPELVAEPESPERQDEEGEGQRDGVDGVAFPGAADADAGNGDEVESHGDTPDVGEEIEDSGEETFDFPLLDDDELGLMPPDVRVTEDPDARDVDEPMDIPERSGLDLPILDVALETADGKEAAGEAESLPEPAWDEEDLPGPVGPSLEEVDLESFVVEVEGADVAGQVGDAPGPEEVEPGWDEPEPETTAEAEDEIVLPILAEAEETDAAAALEEIAGPVDPEEEATGRVEPAEEFEEAPVLTGAESTPDRKRAAWRRPWILAAVVVGVAVVASLLLLGRSSGSGPGTGSPAAAAPGAGGGGQDVPMTPASPGGAEGAGEVPPVVADSAPPPATAADMERLGDALLESISRYYGRAVARDEGEATCEDLQTAYVEVEDRWISYNVQGRARFRGRLPESLEIRDERLYSGVQDVEREFNRSGCERP